MEARKEITDFIDGKASSIEVLVEVPKKDELVVLIEKAEKGTSVKVNGILKDKIHSSAVRVILAYDIVKNNPSRGKEDVLFNLLSKTVLNLIH